MTFSVTGKQDSTAALEALPVSTRADLKRFIRVPWTLYADDPYWIPPLLAERMLHLSPKNPYFQHASWQAWIAYRGGRAVGRISAQVDRLRLDTFADATGSFGLIEAENDPGIFELLLGTAGDWLASQGIKRMQGPFNLSINQECGLLVEGFDSPPFVMMGHAKPWYATNLEMLGFVKAQDLLAYRVDKHFTVSPAMKKLTGKNTAQIHTRPLRREHLKSELDTLRDLFNDAWSQNWGFVPFTEAEFDDLGQTLVYLVDREYIQIAEMDGQAAAMVVALPNLNEAARDLNGRLLPLGWLKLIWRIKRHRLKTARVTLMGIRKQYQNSPKGAALAYAVIDAAQRALIRNGVEEVEMSWILENNRSMRHILHALGSDAYKRYRIYQKELD